RGHGLQTQANGVHRTSGCMATGALDGWSAVCVGGCEDRATRTSDRAVAEAAQGNSGRARANTKKDREDGSEARRGSPLLGGALRGRCDYQGSTSSAAGEGEGDGGRLYRSGERVAPAQRGRRYRLELRRNPLSVLAALQREGISWQRPAKPDLAACRG